MGRLGHGLQTVIIEREEGVNAMKRISTPTLVLVLMLGLCGIADAHGGAEEVLYGTIQAIDRSEIRIESEANGTVVVKIGPTTRYNSLGEESGTLEDLRPGMRVVVELHGGGDVAEEIRYAPEGYGENGNARHGTVDHGHENHGQGGRHEHDDEHLHANGDRAGEGKAYEGD